MKRTSITSLVLAFAVLFGLMTAPVGAKSSPPSPAHQTLKTIATSVVKAKAKDAKANAKAKAVLGSSTVSDVAALQAAAATGVARANAAVQAASASGNTAALWASISSFYAATGTQAAANQVAGDLNTPPPPPPPTTTTTTAPSTTTTTAPVTTTTTQPVTTTTTTQPNAPPSSQILGLYTGSVQSATSLGRTLGLSPLNGYSYYCDGTSWSSISSCAPATGLASGTTQLVGVDLTPNKTGLSAVAANVSTFSTLAKHFVGTPVVFRVGWEMDGSWMPWGTGANGNTAAQYAPAIALVIPAMKAADPAAQFDFSDNTGTSTLAQLKVYMGNNAALYTYVGGDHYADLKSTGIGTMSNMTASVTLASQLNKPFSMGEWGLNGTDNPVWIAAMCQIITNPAAASAANNWPKYTVGPTSYFSAALQINSDISQFPKSEAAFKADCG